MDIYVFLLLVTVLSAIITYKNKNKRLNDFLFVLCSVLLIGTISFRTEDIGTDTPRYYEIFQTFSNLTTESDQGFYLWVLICKLIFHNAHVTLVLTSFLSTLSIFYIIYKESRNKCLSCFLFLTLGTTTIYYILYLCMVRQCLSLSIFYIGIYYFYKSEKNKRSLAWTIFILFCACIIHHATMMFVPILLLYKVNFKKYIGIILIWSTLIIGTIISEYISYFVLLNEFLSSDAGGYGYYISMLTENEYSIALTLPLSLICTAIFILSDSDFYNNLLSKIFIIGVCLNNLVVLMGNSDRFTLYTIPFGLIVISNFMEYLKTSYINNRKRMTLIPLFFFVIVIGYYSSKYNHVMDNSRKNTMVAIYPYTSIFD